MALPDLDRLEITSQDALWDWLDANHARCDSVLLVTHKKSQGDRYVSRDAVLDALIAYGWIDGRRYVVDDRKTAQLIAPRNVQHWAQSYKTRADRLIKEDRMRPAGYASIKQSKESGLWDFMADVDALITPRDLGEELTGSAAQYFADCPDAYKRNLLRWVKLAKTDKTRAKRIAEITSACRDQRRIAQM